MNWFTLNEDHHMIGNNKPMCDLWGYFFFVFKRYPQYSDPQYLTINTCLSTCVPFPSEVESQLSMFTLTNANSNSFNLSWTTREEPFVKLAVNGRDSYSDHEPQKLMVSGEVYDTAISGLVDYPEYDINVQGTTTGGGAPEPLISLVMTGTHLKVTVAFKSHL